MITRSAFQILRKIKLAFLLMVLPALVTGCGSTSFCDASDKALSETNASVSVIEYAVPIVLSGGSGKASVESPARLIKGDEGAELEIIFSSSYYDYIISDGVKYEPVNSEGNSAFIIPVEYGAESVDIIADTTAMSKPHEIAYTLELDYSQIAEWTENGSTGGNVRDALATEKTELKAPQIEGINFTRVENMAAEGFAIYKGDYGISALSVRDGSIYIILPEDNALGERVDERMLVNNGYQILQQPISDVYIAATAVMSFFDELGAMDSVKYSSLKKDGWYIESAADRMNSGAIVYAGKYSAPDYELLLSEGCHLAVESTMILHTPAVREKLTELGIPVLTDYSSHETEPLGRLEWVKVYGLLTGMETAAAAAFEEQQAYFEKYASDEKNSEKTVVVFYINTNGQPVVRRKSDYISRLVEMAGGSYAFSDAGGTSPTVTMTMEAFYKEAKEADVLIYNSAIGEEVATVSQLLKKEPLLADFAAVKSGEVYSFGKDMYQETMAAGEVLAEIRQCLQGEAAEYKFLHHL